MGKIRANTSKIEKESAYIEHKNKIDSCNQNQNQNQNQNENRINQKDPNNPKSERQKRQWQ